MNRFAAAFVDNRHAERAHVGEDERAVERKGEEAELYPRTMYYVHYYLSP